MMRVWPVGEVPRWPEVGRGKSGEARLGSIVRDHLFHVMEFGLHPDGNSGRSTLRKVTCSNLKRSSRI